MARRLLSLDVFRGLTIIGMILVNSPGNQTSYHLLNHSVWNGCTPADLVFPFFVFIVGVSLVFSLTNSLKKGATFKDLFFKIVNRTIIIFFIGLFLNAALHFHMEKLRIPGVLQRIALCYFFGSILFLTTRVRTQVFIFVGLLVGYWVVMTKIPVSGFGAGDLSEKGNLASYIDRMIFTSKHMYLTMSDPEGILSTFPAVASTLLGMLTGSWLLTVRSSEQKCVVMVLAGLSALVIGWIWGYWFPINKALWTSTFVLWTGGLALLLLAVCYWLLDIKEWTSWSKPLEIFGVNALAAYFLHIFFLKVQANIHIPRVDGTPGNLRFFITEHLYGWASLKNASLFYALTYIVFWLFILWILYRKKIFIRA
jgi:predicted acyltransferase